VLFAVTQMEARAGGASAGAAAARNVAAAMASMASSLGWAGG